jgi:hypothetical protein
MHPAKNNCQNAIKDDPNNLSKVSMNQTDFQSKLKVHAALLPKMFAELWLYVGRTKILKAAALA